MMRNLGLIVLALAGAATPAFAATPAADETGYRAIAAGDFAAAERAIVAERKAYPARPELMLNLAAVYRRTGRESAAEALYTEVLARRAVAMDMPSGAVVSSHDLARRALGAATPMQIATR